jgi:Na+-transporting NADH:ubiquinone oxidoreductase subunit NqrF
VLADDENLNGGKFRLDNLSDFQAIHSRHRDVEEYDIWLIFSYFADAISPVYRLANYFDVSL